MKIHTWHLSPLPKFSTMAYSCHLALNAWIKSTSCIYITYAIFFFCQITSFWYKTIQHMIISKKIYIYIVFVLIFLKLHKQAMRCKTDFFFKSISGTIMRPPYKRTTYFFHPKADHKWHKKRKDGKLCRKYKKRKERREKKEIQRKKLEDPLALTDH